MGYERVGPVDATVARWHAAEGWGALRSRSAEGEIWVHFSDIDMVGVRSLRAGQRVTVTYETPGQDGFAHRALHVVPR